ncbi:hypothetical protein Btru_011176 [Bulinus truncatus]|nr:hypothetical protein Btru_011176 [Bulinus truncatus]
MHGRLKVKSTAEQLEAKKKEREKKLLLYNGAMSKIFHKKKNGELDEEMLLLSGEVLVVNPDVYTLWNCRKETFLEFKKSLLEAQLQKMFQSELYFLEMCLKKNPKSYGSWHHRCFVMDNMPHPDWNREIELCNQFLQYDERNFHCWDYRRFVVQRANISPEAEFEFSLNKINNNFSNYSSWHYRSKLLPVLFPDSTQPMGISEEALLKEYELVQNGFFTDPDDQSNWFYHRWLMGRGEKTQTINYFFVSRVDKCAVVSLAHHIQVGKTSDIILECNGELVQGALWLNQDGDTQPSILVNNLEIPQKRECNFKLTVTEDNKDITSSCLSITGNDVSIASSDWKSLGNSRFSQEMSPLKKETLVQALESVLQLMELEAENKWAVLTVVLLMKALDPLIYFEDILKHLDKLEELDSKRTNYYKDLKSKFIVENIFNILDVKSVTSINLSGKNLTKMYHTELLPLVTSLDVSGNYLKEAQGFNFFQNLATLNLSNNRIEHCSGLQSLPKLERLLLNNNNLLTADNLLQLQSCVRLKYLDISQNPLCSNESETEKVKRLLPNTKIIFC